MYVCNTTNFHSIDVENSFLVCENNFRGYRSSSYTKVIGSKSRSQNKTKGKIPYSCNVKLQLATIKKTPVL